MYVRTASTQRCPSAPTGRWSLLNMPASRGAPPRRVPRRPRQRRRPRVRHGPAAGTSPRPRRRGGAGRPRRSLAGQVCSLPRAPAWRAWDLEGAPLNAATRSDRPRSPELSLALAPPTPSSLPSSSSCPLTRSTRTRRVLGVRVLRHVGERLRDHEVGRGPQSWRDGSPRQCRRVGAISATLG